MKNFGTKMTLGLIATLASTSVFAQEAAKAAEAAAPAHAGNGVVALGAAVAIGMAALGGTLAQGKAASTALDGIARNPAAQDKVFTPMILGLALIESLVILSFLIALNLAGKV